jgi:hypothetical protein
MLAARRLAPTNRGGTGMDWHPQSRHEEQSMSTPSDPVVAPESVREEARGGGWERWGSRASVARRVDALLVTSAQARGRAA